jgi:hypothetical protein
VTLSAGACTLVPPRELSLPAFISACTTAMQRAKGKGKNTACATEATDFEHAQVAGDPPQAAGAAS